MSLPKWLSSFFLILAAIFLGTGFWLTGYLPLSLTMAALTLIGLFFLWKGWGWILSVLLVLYTGLSAAGFYLDVAPAWLVLGALAALIAWDQEHLALRMKNAGEIKDLAKLVKNHLARLGWVSLASLLLVWLTFLIQVEFTFGAAVLLAVLAVLGLSQGIGYLRRTGSG